MDGRIEGLREAVLPQHAVQQAARRSITEAEIRNLLESPGQVLPVGAGRIVAQTLISIGDPPRAYGLRVFVDIHRKPPEVVTAYRSSKIAKYWRPA